MTDWLTLKEILELEPILKKCLKNLKEFQSKLKLDEKDANLKRNQDARCLNASVAVDSILVLIKLYCFLAITTISMQFTYHVVSFDIRYNIY